MTFHVLKWNHHTKTTEYEVVTITVRTPLHTSHHTSKLY